MVKKNEEEKFLEADEDRTNYDDDDEDQKEIPSSDLDLQFSLIEPSAQRPKKGLKKKLQNKTGTQLVPVLDKDGNVEKDKEGNLVYYEQDTFDDLAGNLQFWTRDFRLGNLSQWTGEYEYVINYLNLAADFLSEGFPVPALTALNKAMARLETSNSKAAKLRELIQTIRRVSVTGSEKSSQPEFKDAVRKNV